MLVFQVRVAVFAKGEAAEAATAAGADVVGAEDLVSSVMEGRCRRRCTSSNIRHTKYVSGHMLAVCLCPPAAKRRTRRLQRRIAQKYLLSVWSLECHVCLLVCIPPPPLFWRNVVQ